MYLPKHYEVSRSEDLHALIRAHPLGALVSSGEQGIEADHIPFILDPSAGPHGILRGHVARANPLWRRPPAEALVIFQGPQAYVSPGWAPSKRVHGKVVPTWDYAVVHAYGPVRVIEDPIWLRGLLDELTEAHEAGRPEPWRVADAPADFTDKLMGYIVGIEIPISRLVGKFKVGQARSAADRVAVADALLGQDGGSELAQLMRRAVTD